MTNRNTTWITILVAILALGMMVGLVWANHRFIAQDTGENHFTARWYGVRLFLTRGLNPYLPETVAEIEKTAPSKAAAAADGSAFFLYPFYTFIVYTPFALTEDITLARTAWMTVLELAVFAIAGLSLSLSRWKIPKPFLVLLILFVVAWYYTIRPVWNGDISILCALFILLSLLALRAGQDALAGIVLAAATMKPTIILLLAILLMIWAISTSRWRFFWGFIGTVGIIVAATSLLMPTWIADNLRQIVSFVQETQMTTPGSLVAYWLPGIGKQFGWMLSIFSAIILVVEWRLALGKDIRWLLWTVYFTLAITPLTGIPTSLDNIITLFPCLVVILAIWDERWGRIGRWMMLFSMLILSFGVWGFVYYGMQRGISPDLNPVLFFIVPTFSIIGLYWVRWWAIRPPRLLLEDVANHLG